MNEFTEITESSNQEITLTPTFKKVECTFRANEDVDSNSRSNDVQIWNTGKAITINTKYTPSVFDVAEYILRLTGPISTMKLQKLVYYSQAWSLVWLENSIFSEEIEAWVNGPVVRSLFDYHRGHFKVATVEIGNPQILSPEQKECIRSVVEFYGKKSAQYLIDLTHLEKPWRLARNGYHHNQLGNSTISLASIAEYYSGL